jgi:hypothetical protein
MDQELEIAIVDMEGNDMKKVQQINSRLQEYQREMR